MSDETTTADEAAEADTSSEAAGETVDIGEGVTVPARYMEDENHVPNPLYMTGHVDTTGTAGDLAGRIEQVSPAFAQHRATTLRAAADAMAGEGAAPENVILPDKDKSYDDAVAELNAAADAAENDPQLTTGLTPAQQEAARPGEPVNPNAIRSDEHDLSAEGPTAPSNTTDWPNPNAPTTAETGVPNVNPNQESLDAAESGSAAVVVAPDPADDNDDDDDGRHSSREI